MPDSTDATRDLTLAGRPTPVLPELHDVPIAAPHRARSERQGTPVPAPTPAASENPNPSPAAPATSPPPAAPTPVAPPAPRRILVADSVSGGGASASSSGANAPGTIVTGALPSGSDGSTPLGTGKAGGVREGIVAAGTVVVLHPHVAVCTRTNEVGDLFVATLGSPIIAVGGLTVPAGVIVTVQVSAFDPGSSGDGALEFVVRSFGRESDGSVPIFHPAPDTGTVGGGGGPVPTNVAPSDPLVGHARTEETLLGTCVPREGMLRITLTRAVRLVVGG
jgi:hypothetical protein